MGIGLTLGVFGILAGFGIATGLNMMLWGYLGMAGGILGMVISVLRFLAYEQGYSAYSDNKVAADVTAGKKVMEAVKTDGIRDLLFDTSMAITAAGAAESLAYQMWHMMSDEDQQTAVSEWEEAAATLAKSVEEMRDAAGLNGEAKKEEKAEDEEGEDAEEGEGEDAEEGEGDEEAAGEEE